MDGERRVEGTWRPIFIHNGGTYYLTDLKIYADGMVDCWELVNLDGFRQKVASGWVAVEVPHGATISAHDLINATVTEPRNAVTGDDLIGEVSDEIDRLAGRPASSERCRTALDAFLDAPDEGRRDALRAAYFAIPAHRRMYVLGDMDAKDGPIRTLIWPVGTAAEGGVITAAAHERALAYFAERRRDAERAEERRREKEAGRRPAIRVPQVIRPQGQWPRDPGLEALRPEYPRPIRYGDRTYPSVHQAFWTASLADPTGTELPEGPTPPAVEAAAREAGLRPDWPARQLAVMTDLMRRRFAEQPDLADLLRSTGTARIQCQKWNDLYWGHDDNGENWLGRVLELLRSELAEAAAAR